MRGEGHSPLPGSARGEMRAAARESVRARRRSPAPGWSVLVLVASLFISGALVACDRGDAERRTEVSSTRQEAAGWACAPSHGCVAGLSHARGAVARHMRRGLHRD